MLDIDDNIIVDDYLKAYLIYINSFKTLTKKQLIKLYQEQKYEEIFNHNLRLVPFVIKKFFKKRGSLSFMDLIQEGNIALYEAIFNYDYNLNTEFSTYVVYQIMQKISLAIATKSRTINYSYDMHYKIIKYKKAFNKLSIELGHTPTKEQIANETNLTLKQIDDILNHSIETYSLYNPTTITEDKTLKLANLDKPFEEDIINNTVLKNLLKNAKLSKQELDILNLYYFKSLKPKEIAILYNCSRQNIIIKLNKIIKKLNDANKTNTPKISKLSNININDFYYSLKINSLKKITQYFKTFSLNLINLIFNYSLLTKNEKQILSLLLGIDKYSTMSYQEISNLYHTNQEQIKTISQNAFKKISELLKTLYPNLSYNQKLIKKRNQL